MSRIAQCRMIRHIYPGSRPLYELQEYSNDRRKWVMLKVDLQSSKIMEFLAGWDIPHDVNPNIIDCVHEGE